MPKRNAKWCFAIVGLLLLIATLVQAGEFNPQLSVGDAAPAWKDLPGTDGKTHSLGDLKDVPVVVVVFTCNSCAVAQDYEARIVAFAKKHAEQVAVVAISVSKRPEDGLVQMKELAAEKEFPFQYLLDKSQQIGKAYGAAYTPEFFVLAPERKVVYMGGMDDSSVATAVKVNYLEPAVAAALAGKKPEIAETLARGCRIRYQRERRER
jgi:peroxiredoxin